MSNILSRTPFGTMTLDSLSPADAYTGIGRRSTRWQILEAFLRESEGRAARIHEGSSGLIILMEIPGQPGTGAFYLYDENNRHFFTMSFEEQDNFHASMFDYVVQFYDLGQYVEVPKQRLAEKQHIADKAKVSNTSPNKARHHHNRRRKQHRAHVPQGVIASASVLSASVVATA